MRILFFMGGGFDRPSPSQHLEETLISNLLDEGYEIALICSFLKGNSPNIPSAFLEHELFSAYPVERPEVARAHFSKRYLEGIAYALRCRKVLKAVGECDLAFVQSSPTVLFNILSVESVLRNCPIIYGIQDMFPGSSIASGVMRNRLVQEVFFRLQKIAYRHADAITVISEDMAQKVIEQGVRRDKIRLVRNWYNECAVAAVPWDENRFVRKYELSTDVFYVQYAGTTGYVFDDDAFLYAADKLRDNSSIRFQLVAQGARYDSIKERAKAQGLENIDFLPLQPQDMVSDVYSACAVCLIPLRKGVIGNSVPSKAALVMACGRPIISSVDSDSRYAEELDENQVGLATSCDDYQQLVKALEFLSANPAKCAQMGENGASYSRREYTSKKNVNRFLAVIREVLESSSVEKGMQ